MDKLSAETKKIMTDRFGKDSVIALATVDNGMPYVRNVDGYYEDGAFYIITHAHSNKMKQIKKNSDVAVAGEWFTARGKGVDLGYFGSQENAAMAGKLKTAFAQWIDNGHNDFSDVNTCILCVELKEGLLFSDGTAYEIDFRE